MNDERWQMFLKKWQIKGSCGSCRPLTVERYVDKLPSPQTHKTVLDIGARGGGHFNSFTKRGYDVQGIDLTPRIEGILFGDMHDMPVLNGVFDIVFCCETLEHSICPVMAISEMNRVLRIGGQALVIMPSFFNVKWRDVGEHNWVVPYESVKALFLKCGFKIVHYAEELESPEGGNDQLSQIYIFEKVTDVQ